MRPDRVVTLCFLVSVAASIGLAVVYWNGGQPQLEGTLLALTLGGIGLAIVLWAQAYMPGGEAVEERGTLASGDDDVEAFAADFETGEEALHQRRALLASGAAAMTALGAALLFPIRSLGPRPGKDLKVTPFGPGVRVVGEDGEPLKPSDLAIDGVVTVWPDGHVGAADAPTLLIRVRADQEIEHRPGREDWVIDDVIAYSKLCTHTGCPVGLYQAEEALLLCPCHQSTFDVLRGAEPVFGPAARSLPQLPLAVDDEGFIVANGDFSSPVGPGFWDRGR